MLGSLLTGWALRDLGFGSEDREVIRCGVEHVAFCRTRPEKRVFFYTGSLNNHQYYFLGFQFILILEYAPKPYPIMQILP